MKNAIPQSVAGFDLRQNLIDAPRRSIRQIKNLSAARELHPAMQRRLQQFAKLPGVEFGVASGQMAAGLRARRNQIERAVFDPFHRFDHDESYPRDRTNFYLLF